MDGWDVLSQLLALAKAAEAKGKKVDLTKGIEAYWKVIEDTADQTPAEMKV
jgi:hypothetical protein